MSKIKLGCEPAVGSLTPSKKFEYKLCNRLHEGKRPHYAIAFNFLNSRYFNVFATIGGTRATVYQCLDGGSIAVLQAYNDEDKEESYRSLSWACGIDGAPFLVVAGSNRIIRVINTATEKIYKSIVGHGGSINEIRTQALNPSLIVSASKDESVRLWNVHTGICILIFAGAGGHHNEVLSVSVDNVIVLWEPEMKEQSPGEGAVDILHKYPVPDCHIRFIKFSCDFHFKAVAIGNRKGKIYVWELQSSPPVLRARLSHSQCKSAIRQTTMSVDGSIILGCSEDGSIWRWDAPQQRSLINSGDEHPPIIQNVKGQNGPK